MKNTYKELVEILKDHFEYLSNFAFEYDFTSPNFKEKFGEVKRIEQVGGEDEGSHWHAVHHFVDHDVYIKTTGYYSSYEGVDFDGGWDDCCEEVRPQEKMITVYE